LLQASFRDLTGGCEDAERDRQIEAPGLFRQISRSQIDSDAAGGKFEARVL